MPHLTRSLVPLALIAILIAAPSSAAAPGRPAEGPLVLGSVASLSGDASPYGRDQARGSALAATDLSRGGRGVSLRGADDRSRPDPARRAFRRFVGLPVGAIVGPTLSPVAEAADPIATKAGTPVLAATNTTMDIQRLPTVWRVGLGEEAMIPAAVAAASDRHDISRAGLLVDAADGYSRGAAAAFARAARGARVEIGDRAAYGTGATVATAAAALLGRPVAERPQAIFIAARSDAAAAALKAVRAADPAIPMVGGNGFTPRR